MRVKVKMPKLGLTMTEGTIVEWKKAVGDPVAAGEVLLVIETEKTEVELEAPASGTLVEILGEVRAVYPIGEILGALRSARLKLVRKFEQLGEQDVARSSIHPRLKKPMRLVDWCYFMAEHDDHHVARITALGRLLNRGNRRKVDLP